MYNKYNWILDYYIIFIYNYYYLYIILPHTALVNLSEVVLVIVIIIIRCIL